MTIKQPQPSSEPEQRPKAKTKTELLIAEHVARLVAEAPPLSPWQRNRLAELFASARDRYQPEPERRQR